MRRLLLHEGSRRVANSGAEYGQAPRKMSNSGTFIRSAPPSRTLRHRAAKSAVTYAKHGAQSGLKSFLPRLAGGTNMAIPVTIARPKFETRSALYRERRARKKLADVLQPLLVAKQKTSIFACNRSPQACKLLPITAAANRFLLYVLKYIPPQDVCTQLIYDTEHLSAELLEVCVTFAAPFGMRCQWAQGKQGKVKKNGASRQFVGKLLNQPMMTFSKAAGMAKKIKKGSAQQLSQMYPFVHIAVFRWYESHLPPNIAQFLSSHRAYVCVLSNLFSQLHGGPDHPEKKVPVDGGWDSFTSHFGAFEGGHLLVRIPPSEGANVLNAERIGTLGTPIPDHPGGIVVSSSVYHYGKKKHIPRKGSNKDLSEYGNAVPASELFFVSCRNAVTALNTAYVHGSTDFVLKPSSSVNPCKFTAVCALKGPRTMHMPKAGDAIAVFEGGQRIFGRSRTQRQPIVRQRYDKLPKLAWTLEYTAKTKGMKYVGVKCAKVEDSMMQGDHKNRKRKPMQ